MQNNINKTLPSQNISVSDEETSPATNNHTEKKPRLESRPEPDILTDGAGRRFRNGVEIFNDSESQTVSALRHTPTNISTNDKTPKQTGKGKTASLHARASSKTNTATESGASLYQQFQRAITSGDLGTVRELIGQRPELVHQADQDGVPPLFQAIRCGQTTIATMLVWNGASTAYQDKFGRTALHLAIAKGHQSLAEIFITLGVPVNQADNHGQTPLLFAAEKGHTQLAKLLTQNNAYIDQPDNDGRTPLMMATMNGQTELARLLINQNAATDKVNNNGSTALTLACKSNQPEILNMLIDRLPSPAALDALSPTGFSLLMYAADSGHTNIVELLLARGATIDLPGIDGWTALMIAADNGKKPVIATLLAHGADIKQKNHAGWTALMHACQTGDLEIVKLLFKKSDSYKKHPEQLAQMLRTAAFKGHATVLEFLLKNSATALALPKEILSGAANLAFKKGHHEALTVLIKHGIHPDLTSETAWESIMKAADNGNNELLSLILSKFSSSLRLSPSSWLSKDISPKLLLLQQWLINAVQHGRDDIAHLLIQAGAKPDYIMDDGNSALIEAIRRGNVNMVFLILEQKITFSRQHAGDKLSNELLLAIGNDTPNPLLVEVLLNAEHQAALKKRSTSVILDFNQIFDGSQKLIIKSYIGTKRATFPKTEIVMMLCTEFNLSHIIADRLAICLKNSIDAHFSGNEPDGPPTENQLRMAFADSVASEQLFNDLTHNQNGFVEKFFGIHEEAPDLARKLAHTAASQAALLIREAKTATTNHRTTLHTYLNTLTSSTTSGEIRKFMQQAGWHPGVTQLVVECWASLIESRTKDALFKAINASLGSEELGVKFEKLASDSARSLLHSQINRLRAIMLLNSVQELTG